MMKILETEKKNFLIKKNGLYGFFNQKGAFLRQANIDEWHWALDVMPKAQVKNIDFDFAALERGQAELSQGAKERLRDFMKYPLDLVDNILQSFDIRPEALEICGQMSPDWTTFFWSDGVEFRAKRNHAWVWAISNGLITRVPRVKLQYIRDEKTFGEWGDEGYSAEYLLEVSPQAQYFVVYHNYDESNANDYENWEIYSAAKLKPLKEELKDMAKIKIHNFLSRVKRVSPKNYGIFYKAIREFGLSDRGIVNMQVGEIDRDWSVYGNTTGGVSYLDRNEYSVWAVTAERILRIDSTTIYENGGQNANGSYVDDMGYHFNYLKKKAPDALFFIMQEVHEYRADNQESKGYIAWHLLRMLSKKELMIKKINSKNRVSTLGDCFPQLQTLINK